MATCEEHPLDVPVVEDPIIGDSTTTYDLLLYIAAGCAALASLLSLLQIFRHATNYTAPLAQKQIIRILFMVPVYSISCALSIHFYSRHVYLAAGYEFYESIAVASFFILMCQEIRPEWSSLRRVFNLLRPKPWFGPLRLIHMCIRRRRSGQPSSGLRWLNIVSLAILQFVVVKFFGALAKIITESRDVYCAESNSTQHASIWIGIVEMASLVVAMLYLLQFYDEIKEPLKEHNPLLKVLSIKAVVFLFYLQSFIFARLTAEDGPLQPTGTLSYPTLAAGIPNLLLCIEMLLVSIVHFWAYPVRPYVIRSHKDSEGQTGSGEETQQSQKDAQRLEVVHQGGILGWKAYVDAIVIADILWGIGQFSYWIFFSRTSTDSARLDDEFAQRNPTIANGGGPFRTDDLKSAMQYV
ncbi:organic solute transporter Ostalpha-domain-containing protein [Stachybotrys elegans]|uniref:Organic solute transporter Ostalpha-domain-containing protein n=1 Tax=Stachybotrys elegans TaxID=80388 RepID=A0A8K0SSE5_9HYPO|nr:organic solute transporter Ostalpha-domain-containing protein [Stachybotrys elegans]